jgi:hypothetical protein
MLFVTYATNRDQVRGWRYLWAKHAVGFAPSVHCARCLKGDYLNQFGKDMGVNVLTPIDLPAGELVYFCGVATPYVWANNLHLAVRVKPGASAVISAYNGDVIEVDGAEQVHFDDKEARRLFPERAEEFLTCRNFQFAAQVWGRP